MQKLNCQRVRHNQKVRRLYSLVRLSMKQFLVKFLAALVTLYFIFGISPSSNFVDAQSKKARRFTPAEWRKVNPRGWFTFYLPSGMKGGEPYADSDGGEYRSDNMRVYFDYWLGNQLPRYIPKGEQPLDYYVNKPEYRKEIVRIGGRKAQMVTCMIPDKGNNLPYHAEVYFANVRMPEWNGITKGGLTIVVAYKKRGDLKIAKRILNSVVFPR